MSHHFDFRMHLILAAGSALAITGCTSNPFALEEDDRARRVALQRLRDITPAQLERYAKPAPAEGVSGESSAYRSRLDAPEKISLTLEECRAAALIGNLDLKVAVQDPSIARERISEEEARFESVFVVDAAAGDFDQPSPSQLDSNQSSFQSIEPKIRVPTVTGGRVEVSAPFSRRKTDNQFNFLEVTHATDLEFSVSHPLLRNSGRRVNTGTIRIAGYQEQAAQARTKLEIIRQLASADRAYWNLYQVRKELEVRRQQLELAQNQLDRAKRRVAAGAASDIEVVRADAGVAERIEAIIVSENTILLRQRELKRLMNRPGLDVDTATIVELSNEPDPVEFALDLDQLLREALAQRMELLEFEIQLAADAVQQELDRDQLLPLVNLTYLYRLNGLGGSLGNSLDVLTEADHPDWQLSLSAEMPLGNEAAESRLRQTILRRLSRLHSKASREQAIRQEVLNAADALSTGWQRILAARQSVVLNTRALRAEQRAFDVGNSTTTNVLDAAARLAESQFAEIRALTDYQIGQVDLAFATGTLLGASKTSWEPAPSPEIGQPDPPEALPSESPAPEQP